MTFQFQKHLMMIQQVWRFIMCLFCLCSWLFTRLQLNYGCFTGLGNGDTSRRTNGQNKEKNRPFTGARLANPTFVGEPYTRKTCPKHSMILQVYGLMIYDFSRSLDSWQILIPTHPTTVLSELRYFSSGEKEVSVPLYRTSVTPHFECTVLGTVVMKLKSHTARESNLFSYRM